jgi:plasmid maintenance system antidote protein VapI
MNGPEDFTRWLEDNGFNPNSFGRKHGMDDVTVRELARGERVRITVELAAKIEDITGIPMRAWVKS